ncbi:MAG: flagellar M-ring protein FliF [Bdellovibrionales bacterium]|nr:flagellar M-ring protein FliF [Bdellovibrionales bacterium]
MGEYLSKVSKQIAEFFGALSGPRKLSLAVTAAAILAGTAALFIWASRTAYVPLMTNLNPEDAANIMRVLREKGIPFVVDGSGRNISVPSETVHETRLGLSTLGMPQSSVVGYEVFDKQSLGTTSFVQKLNQKRAREGELMRTINSIRGVKRSRVHLAIPEKSTFVEDQKKSTASVVLDLEPGIVLNEKQIFGISNLVARAVEGMDANDVAIVDSNGKMISRNASDSVAGLTSTQIETRRKYERDIESSIEGMLSRVVGEGHVVARVSADLDFSQVAETQTIYDQEGSAVRSTEKNNQSMEGTRPSPGGPAGAASNTPGTGTGPTVAEIKNNTSRVNEVVNYAVPQTVRTTTRQPGLLRKLSIAVVVDGKQVREVAKDGQASVKNEPWSQEKLQEFEAIVAGAVALDRKRGDTLEIKNMEFTRDDLDSAQRELAVADRDRYIRQLVPYGAVGVLFLVFFLVVVRPFIKWMTENTIDSVDTFLPQTIEELEKLQRGNALSGLENVVPEIPDRVDPDRVEGDMIREKIVSLVDNNPQKAALILKDWVLGVDGPRKKEDRADSGKSKSVG